MNPSGRWWANCGGGSEFIFVLVVVGVGVDVGWWNGAFHREFMACTTSCHLLRLKVIL